jgi:Glycosyltransferase
VFLLSRIIRQLKKIQPDVIYFESIHVWNLFILSHLRFRCPFVSSIHDVKPHSDDLKGHLIKKITNIVAKRSDAIFLRSDFEFRSFCDLYPRFSHKAFFFPLSKHFSSFSPLTNESYVLFFGRMTQYKGLDEFYEIARKCPDVNFVVAGKFDDHSLSLKFQSLSNIKVIDRYISDQELFDFLIGSFCVIAPYKAATQSGVAIQAFQCSRPVIAFDVGGLHEQILNGVDGYLIPPGDIDGFAHQIQAISSLPFSEKNQMCKNSFDIGKDKFSSSNNASLFYKMLKEIHDL